MRTRSGASADTASSGTPEAVQLAGGGGEGEADEAEEDEDEDEWAELTDPTRRLRGCGPVARHQSRAVTLRVKAYFRATASAPLPEEDGDDNWGAAKDGDVIVCAGCDRRRAECVATTSVNELVER